MSADPSEGGISQTSPRFKARVAGEVYRLYFLSAIFAQLLASHLSRYIEALGVVAEGLLMLWLLIFGVNPGRWREQAGGVRESRTLID
ncbi:MAG TPA: hypothetical protein VIH46_12065 [Candidatus Acidoferrales bacterium]